MKSSKLVDSGIPIFCGVLLVMIITFTFSQIVLRQFCDFSLNWSDEVSQFCLTWLALIGSIWATKNNQHIATGLKIHQKLNKRLICLIDGILALLICIVATVITYQTTIFTIMAMDNAALSLRWIKMGYIFIVLPLAMLCTCYYCLKSFFKNMALIFKKN
jgi:TRAP-type C4-dicarboxylate transport system permease small subunit